MAAPMSERENRSKDEGKVADAPNIEMLENQQWMVRACHSYYDEYKECKSWPCRWHHYYIHGSHADCDQWRHDYEKCLLFRTKDDVIAADSIVGRELDRREQRLTGARGNDVWQPRSSPPTDWTAPLPEYKHRHHGNGHHGNSHHGNMNQTKS